MAGLATPYNYQDPRCSNDRSEIMSDDRDKSERWRHQWHEVHKKLKALAKQDERVQLLQTIPGVGRKTAEVVVAYIDDPHRFKNSRQVSSYAGLVPRRFQSGRWTGKAGFTSAAPDNCAPRWWKLPG